MMEKMLEQIVELLKAHGLSEKEIRKVEFLKNTGLPSKETSLLNDDNKGSKPLFELYDEIMALVKGAKSSECLISSGYKTLDDRLGGGIFPGELFVIGGRPGMGKTQFAVNLAVNASKKLPVLYFSYDLSETLLTKRILSAITQIPWSKMIPKKLLKNELHLLESKKGMVIDSRFLISEIGCNSISMLIAEIHRSIVESNIKIVVIDDLQMLSLKGFKDNRHKEISFICRELKTLAKEENISIIFLSQLSRSVEMRGGNKIPVLSDLLDSGAIEQYADKVLFLYRPELYNIHENEFGFSTKGIVEVIVAKNKNGKLGSVKLLADENFTGFTDYEENVRKFKIDPGRLEDFNDQ